MLQLLSRFVIEKMKVLRRTLFIVGAISTISSLVMATPCVSVTANNLASDNGCVFGFPTEQFQFDNFTFVVNSQTNPGGLALTDSTISFFTDGDIFDGHVGLSVNGDSQWNISSGGWSFTLSYTVTQVGQH